MRPRPFLFDLQLSLNVVESMGEGFFPGFCLGALCGGILVFIVIMAMATRASKQQHEEQGQDDPDWWKKGQPPPY